MKPRRGEARRCAHGSKFIGAAATVGQVFGSTVSPQRPRAPECTVYLGAQGNKIGLEEQDWKLDGKIENGSGREGV